MKTLNLKWGLFCIALSVLFFSAFPLCAQQIPLPSSEAKEFKNYDQWKQHQAVLVEQSIVVPPVVNTNEHDVPQTESVPCADGLIPVDGSYSIVPRGDDNSTGLITLPFVFNFCNATFTSVYINTNGNLTFTGPNGTFNPAGFPISTPMVAAFWADVDTRPTCSGVVSYKVQANELIVSWNNVGYYSLNCNLLNTFQIIITDGTSALIGVGNNIQFRYGDMQWTTGAATPGYAGGFGGTGATVGFNSGSGSNFEQVGRFNQPGFAYDGPFGAPDGVSYLDGKCFAFSQGNNAPIANCKPAFNLVLDGTGNASISVAQINNGSTDDCGIDELSIDPTTFTCDDIGPNVVTLTVTDEDNNESTCTTTVTVVDNDSPVAVCEEDITVYVGSSGYVSLDPADVDAGSIDNCGIVSYSVDPGRFDCDDVGLIYTVILTVEDASGNENSCLTLVTVLDDLDPVALCQDYTIQLDANGTATLVPSDVDDGSYDNCGIVSYTVAPNSFTCDDLDETTVVTLTVVDASGNTASCDANVTVSDNNLPDDDCDGISNVCDICPGGDDSVDNNNDGIADCAQLLAYNAYSNAWHCSPNATQKINICHNGNTLCVNFNALAAHYNHGDWVGPCASCDEGKTAPQLAHGFRVAPNPSNNTVLVDLHEYLGKNLTLTLRDNLGRAIWEKSWDNLGDDVIEIAFKEQGWGAGAYHLTLLSEGEQTTMRIVITE